MSYSDYLTFVAEHPEMHTECENLREAMLRFVTKYRVILEDRALGRWACDERATLRVIFDNREALALAERIPTWWENEE